MTPPFDKKSPWLVLAPMLAIGAIVLWIVLPWFLHRPDLGRSSLIVAILTTLIWMLLTWWALQHLAFQLAALLSSGSPVTDKQRPVTKELPLQRIAIFYTTCDDVVPDSLKSCITQDYTGYFKVFVCDDSQKQECRSAVDLICSGRTNVEIVRRSDLSGFKAGNLNHAFKHVGGQAFDWIVTVDADQFIHPDFLSRLSDDIASAPERAACIQAVASPPDAGGCPLDGPFQQTMAETTCLLLNRDLAWRSRAGFYPCLGRVAAIRALAWVEIGGFPECVTEDFAFAMAARNRNWFCIPATHARLVDRGPKDFEAFVIQLSKYAAGTSEVLRRFHSGFLKGPASWVERLDATIWLTAYTAMPLVLLNLPLSAWLAGFVWQQQLCLVPPALAGVFIGMTLLHLPVLVSVTETPAQSIRHLSWTFAIYNAALPSAAFSFVRHFWRQPVFRSTPKGDWPGPRLQIECLVTATVGLFFLAMAVGWRSPFSLIIGSAGAAQMMFPLLRHLHEKSALGVASRVLVWLPATLFIIGVFEMWLRGSC